MKSTLRGIHLATVIDVHPETYEVSIALPNLGRSEGIRIRLGGEWQHPTAGEFRLPERFDKGIVAFYADHPRCGVWLKALSMEEKHLIPTELFKEDKFAHLHHLPSDRTTVQFGDGSEEHRWPDGSFLNLLTRKDGSKSNSGLLRKLLDRFRTLGKMGQPGGRKKFTGQSRPPVDVMFHHSSGAEVWISADGSFEVKTPRGHKFRLYDATEKGRSPQDGSVTSTPDEDAQRIASEVTLETEMGHKLTFHDDPQVAEKNRYVSLKTALGHEILMKDKPDTDQFIKIKTNLGHEVFMRDKPDLNQHIKVRSALGHEVLMQDTPLPKMQLTSSTGQSLKMDDTLQIMTLTAPIIVLDGIIQLGGLGAVRPVVGNADVDTRGDATIATSTKVFIQ